MSIKMAFHRRLGFIPGGLGKAPGRKAVRTLGALYPTEAEIATEMGGRADWSAGAGVVAVVWSAVGLS